MIRALLFSILVLVAPLAGSAAAEEASPTTIFLVRHAEKEAGRDPALTPDGAARAARLATQLADAGIKIIYSTDTKRTRETAAPLAEKLGLEITLYDPYDLPGFAEHLKAAPKTALVVGHSNTTPQLVVLLGGEATPIPETDYERLYCVDGDSTTLLIAGGDTLKGTGCP